jgi:23S rRNA pseudouridine2605 synthase
MIRLQKYIALCGYTSRRKAEELISKGKVSVDGEVITELGFKVDEHSSEIIVEGHLLKPESRKVYVLLNKPMGYISSVSDQFGRKTVIDLVDGIDERLYPVGRLDYDTSGLIILTNDGEFTNIITHPRYHVKKTYRVLAEGDVNKYKISLLEKGVDIGGYITGPAKIENIKKIKDNTMLDVTISEGKNRQVRKMFDVIMNPVLSLERIKIGDIEKGNLGEGKWRMLTENEINYLRG